MIIWKGKRVGILFMGTRIPKYSHWLKHWKDRELEVGALQEKNGGAKEEEQYGRKAYSVQRLNPKEHNFVYPIQRNYYILV